MLLTQPLLDTWADLAKLFQDSKTWDFIGNVGYAAAIGIGGFVVRKFGLKIRKNATAIGAITTDVLALAKENETLKTDLAKANEEKTDALEDRDRWKSSYEQQQASSVMLNHLFELSKQQWAERERTLMLQLEDRPTAPLLKSPRPEGVTENDTTEHSE